MLLQSWQPLATLALKINGMARKHVVNTEQIIKDMLSTADGVFANGGKALLVHGKTDFGMKTLMPNLKTEHADVELLVKLEVNRRGNVPEVFFSPALFEMARKKYAPDIGGLPVVNADEVAVKVKTKTK